MAEEKMKHIWMVEDTPANDGAPSRNYWTKIGVAFENADGSWSLQLSAVPVSGKMQLRDPAPPTLTASAAVCNAVGTAARRAPRKAGAR